MTKMHFERPANLNYPNDFIELQRQMRDRLTEMMDEAAGAGWAGLLISCAVTELAHDWYVEQHPSEVVDWPVAHRNMVRDPVSDA